MFKSRAPRTETFVQPEIESGLANAQIGLMINLGKHEVLPAFYKDNAGKIQLDKDGNPKVKPTTNAKGEQKYDEKVAVYVDLLDQTHDHGETIGVRNIRIPLHQMKYGVSEGINYTTVAPRDPEGNYIKGRAWTLAPASKWSALAKAMKLEQTKDSKTVHDVIFDPASRDVNNISFLVGRPFNITVEHTTTEKDGKTYHNTKLKSPVPLATKEIGKTEAPLQAAIVIDLNDDDLLSTYEYESPNGTITYRKIDLIRKADLLKIVLAENYEGSKMQEAIQSEHDEDELIEQAKEKQAKILETDKDYIAVMEYLNKQNGSVAAAQKANDEKTNDVPDDSGNDDDSDDIPY